MGLFDGIVAGATSVYNNVASAVSSALSSAGSAASQVGSTAVSAAQQAAQAANVWGSGAISAAGSTTSGIVSSAGGAINNIQTAVQSPITTPALSAAASIAAIAASPVTIPAIAGAALASGLQSSLYKTPASSGTNSLSQESSPSVFTNILGNVQTALPSAVLSAGAMVTGNAGISAIIPVASTGVSNWVGGLIGGAYAKATDVYAAKQTTVPSSDLHSSLAGYNGGGADWSPLLIPTYDTSSLPAGTTTRSDYYSATQAGNATTQALATKLSSTPYLLGTIQPYKSYWQAVGVALEAQRETTTGHAQSYYTNELEKLVESNVGISSEYHYNAMASGVQTAANPYEYLGDLSVEFLKGEPTKSSEVFSPVSGELKSYLPTRGGLQEWAWNRAEGKNENVSYMPALAYLASAEGLEGPYGALYGGTGAKYVSAGDVSQRLSAWSGLPRSASVTTVMPTQVGAVEPTTVMKTSGEGTSVLQPSGFDLWASNLNIPILSGFAVGTSDFWLSGNNPVAGVAKEASSIVNTISSGNLGNVISGKSSLSPDSFSRYMATTVKGTPVLSSSLTTNGESTTTVKQLADGSYETTTSTPSTTTEGYTTPILTTYTPVTGGFETISKNYGKEIENILPSSVKDWYNSPTKSSGNFFISGDTGSFGIGTDYTNAFLKGALKGAVEDPLTSIMNVAVGAALAGVGEGLASYGTKVVASTEGMGALSTVAKGANWAVNTGAPYILGGLYLGDVAGRSTSWGKDLTPTAAEKFGTIFSTETGPMILGGTLWASRGSIKESLPSFGEGVGKIYEATNFPNTPDIGDIGGALKTTASDTLHSLRQRASGVENIGRDSGPGYDYNVKPSVYDIKSSIYDIEPTVYTGMSEKLNTGALMLRGTQTGDRISFGSEHPLSESKPIKLKSSLEMFGETKKTNYPQIVYGNVEKEISPLTGTRGFQTLGYSKGKLPEIGSRHYETLESIVGSGGHVAFGKDGQQYGSAIKNLTPGESEMFDFLSPTGERVVGKCVGLADVDKFGRRGGYVSHAYIVPKGADVSGLKFVSTTEEALGLAKKLNSGALMLRGEQIGGGKISFGSEHPIFGELLGGRSGTVEYMGNPFLEEGGKLIPDVSKDTTRLYRGETATGEIKQIPDWLSSQPEVKATREATGRWFTNNLSDAEWYAREGLGKISYVDVPNKVADLYRVDNLGSGVSDFTSTGKELTEFFLPRSTAESKQPLTNIGRTPTSEEVSYYTGKYGTKPMQLRGEPTLGKGRGLVITEEGIKPSKSYGGVITEEMLKGANIQFENNPFLGPPEKTPYFENKPEVVFPTNVGSLYKGKVSVGNLNVKDIKSSSEEEQFGIGTTNLPEMFDLRSPEYQMSSSEIDTWKNLLATGRAPTSGEEALTITKYKELSPSLSELIGGQPVSPQTQAFHIGRASEWEDIWKKSPLEIIYPESKTARKIKPITEVGSLPGRVDITEYEKTIDRLSSPAGIKISQIKGASQTMVNPSILSATRAASGIPSSATILDTSISRGLAIKTIGRAIESKEIEEVVPRAKSLPKRQIDFSNFDQYVQNILESEKRQGIKEKEKTSVIEKVNRAASLEEELAALPKIGSWLEGAKSSEVMPPESVVNMEMKLDAPVIAASKPYTLIGKQAMLEQPDYRLMSPERMDEEFKILGESKQKTSGKQKQLQRLKQEQPLLQFIRTESKVETYQSLHPTLGLSLSQSQLQTQSQQLLQSQHLKQSLSLKSSLMQGQEQLLKLSQEQKQTQEQRQEQRLKSEQVSKQDTSSALDRITGLGTRQALRTTQRTRQDITTDITTEIVPDLRIRIKTDKIIIPGVSDLGGSGPGGGGALSGFTFTEKLNVVSRRQALIGDRMDTMTGLGKASNSKKFKMF